MRTSERSVEASWFSKLGSIQAYVIIVNAVFFFFNHGLASKEYQSWQTGENWTGRSHGSNMFYWSTGSCEHHRKWRTFSHLLGRSFRRNKVTTGSNLEISPVPQLSPNKKMNVYQLQVATFQDLSSQFGTRYISVMLPHITALWRHPAMKLRTCLICYVLWPSMAINGHQWPFRWYPLKTIKDL